MGPRLVLDAEALQPHRCDGMQTRRKAATGAVLLALVVSAVEGTVVTTAMPTIARELGGAALYGWFFAAFLITQTIGVIVCGRLADAFGRRPVFAGGVTLFLLGSALCGAAPGIRSLIVFRAVQGFGAGAVHPLAMTITGDLYTVEERARIQGVLTATWGLANLVGPLLGGFIATHVGWRWVFYVNLPFGALSLVVAILSYVDPKERVRLFAPIISSELFHDRVVRTGLSTSVLGGGLVNAARAYIPPWVEHDAHGTPVIGGAALVALMLGWAAGSTFGVRIYVVRGMSASAGGGFVIATIGFALTALLATLHAPLGFVLPALLFTGMGLGPALSTSMIGPQSRASWSERGMMTSMLFGAGAAGGAAVVWALGHGPQGTFRFLAMAVAGVVATFVGLRAPPVSGKFAGVA